MQFRVSFFHRPGTIPDVSAWARHVRRTAGLGWMSGPFAIATVLGFVINPRGTLGPAPRGRPMRQHGACSLLGLLLLPKVAATPHTVTASV